MTPDEISRLPYRKNVGVMLLNAQGAVFVGQRKDSDLPAWQMPQGGIDPGEDSRTAALRELQEETGIAPDRVEIMAQSSDWVRYDLPHDLVQKLWKGRWRGQEQKWFLMRFLGSDADVDLTAHDEEFSEWRWIEPAELPGQIVPFKRAVYETVLEEFSEYLG